MNWNLISDNIDRLYDKYLSVWEDICNIESPTADKRGVDAVGVPAATSLPTIRLNYFLREVAGVWHYIILGGQYHD